MKKGILIVLFLQSIFMWSQITLPIQQSNIPKNNLVVNYDFSNPSSFSGTGTAVTNVASSTTGTATLLNSPGFIRNLGYVAFNGANQYLITPNLESYFKSVTAGSIQESHSISLWIYPLSANGIILSEFGAGSIGAGWQDSQIEMVNGTIKFRVWPGTEILNSTNTIALNQWHHIVMVYDGTSTKGYVDGVLQGTKTYARQSPINYGYDLHYGIGAYTATQMGAAAYGKFNLGQFKMYSIPLNDSDVAQEYKRENTKFNYVVHSPDTNTNPTYWSVSSAWNPLYGPSGTSAIFSEISYRPWLNSDLGWIAQTQNTSQFITLNYDEPASMLGIIVRGRAELDQWVSSAHIDVSMDGLTWTRVLSNATLNSNYTEDVKLLFPSPVFAKYVRVSPLNWNNYITMRMGLLVKPNNAISNGLVLNLDAANLKSYPGSGTTWTDLSGNSNNGTLTNGPVFNAGAGGQIVLDGVNDAVTTATIPSTSGNNSRTVMAWYKSTANRNTAIVDKGSVLDDGAEQLFVAYANSVGTTNAYPPTNPGGIVLAFWGNDLYYPIDSSLLFDGNWHFVAYTYDNTNSSVRICFDGTFATTVYQWNTSWTTNSSSPFVLPNSINTANNPVLIGQNRGALWGNGGLYSSAAIPFVQLYNRALSESEILTNYNATRSRYGR